MKNQFIDYKHSKMLKKLKFNEKCSSAYGNTKSANDDLTNEDTSGVGIFHVENKNSENKGYYCSAPTYMEVKEWLWEKHKVIVEHCYNYNCTEFAIRIYQNGTIMTKTFQTYNSPILAEKEGIKKTVECLHSQLKK